MTEHRTVLVTNHDLVCLFEGRPMVVGAKDADDTYALASTRNWRDLNEHIAQGVDAGKEPLIMLGRPGLASLARGNQVIALAQRQGDTVGFPVVVRKYTADEWIDATKNAVAPCTPEQVHMLTADVLLFPNS